MRCSHSEDPRERASCDEDFDFGSSRLPRLLGARRWKDGVRERMPGVVGACLLQIRCEQRRNVHEAYRDPLDVRIGTPVLLLFGGVEIVFGKRHRGEWRHRHLCEVDVARGAPGMASALRGRSRRFRHNSGGLMESSQWHSTV